MHKDQKRLQDVFLPQLAARIVAEGPEAERDCTILNRLLVQGPDPLFIMEADPILFEVLCRNLKTTLEAGREAIEKAHWMGPATLLGDGSGLDPENFSFTDEQSRLEALWLILASVSDCTEDGYGEDVTLLERVRRAFAATSKLSNLLGITFPDENGEREPFVSIEQFARNQLRKFIESTEFTVDEATGIPHATADHAFYVLYKQGYDCVAVKAGGLTFYGTPPHTTLEEQGVTVDKPLSPHFGIVFPKGD
jgi:hypothetical protein